MLAVSIATNEFPFFSGHVLATYHRALGSFLPFVRYHACGFSCHLFSLDPQTPSIARYSSEAARLYVLRRWHAAMISLGSAARHDRMLTLSPAKRKREGGGGAEGGIDGCVHMPISGTRSRSN